MVNKKKTMKYISLIIAILFQFFSIKIDALFCLHTIPFIIGFSGGPILVTYLYYILSTLVYAIVFRKAITGLHRLITKNKKGHSL